MRYLGGKSKLAVQIVDQIEQFMLRGPIWDPFCGGLSISAEIARKGLRVTASDVNPALISMYREFQCGWIPPESISEEDYRAAKSLPDSDPRKAFCGFGCSFGGKWFGGFARSGDSNFASICARSLKKSVSSLIHFEHCSFFDVVPRPGWTIYCDPPYAGTTQYAGAPEFDSEAFWSRAADWSRAGSVILVSEYRAPAGWAEIWSASQKNTVGLEKATAKTVTEKLFRFEA